MERCGNVTAIDGKKATVRVKMANSCSSSCEYYGICKKHEEDIIAENKIGAAVGDRVRVEYENGPFLLFAFITFILPLILCLGLAAAAWYIFYNAVAAVVSGAVGLGLSVAVIFITNARIKKREKTAVITAFEEE